MIINLHFPIKGFKHEMHYSRALSLSIYIILKHLVFCVIKLVSYQINLD